MGKKEKTKAKGASSNKPGLAKASELGAKSAPISLLEEKATASEPTPKPPPLPTGSGANAAVSTDSSGTPTQPPAFRQIDVTLGQIVTILMRSPQHRQRPLADLEWLVLPAVLNGQCRVAQATQSGIAVPLGWLSGPACRLPSISGSRIYSFHGASNPTSGAQATSPGSLNLSPTPPPSRRS